MKNAHSDDIIAVNEITKAKRDAFIEWLDKNTLYSPYFSAEMMRWGQHIWELMQNDNT